MSKLVCIKGHNKGDEWPLHEGKNLIGRTQDAQIVLFDQKCSRSHCQIIKKGQHYSIEDLESRNGTLLNGKPLTGRPKSCKFGDKVRIGKTVLVVSDKGVGGLIDQTASDVAADLQRKQFGKLLSSTSRAVTRSQQSESSGLKGFFGRLFGRK